MRWRFRFGFACLLVPAALWACSTFSGEEPLIADAGPDGPETGTADTGDSGADAAPPRCTSGANVLPATATARVTTTGPAVICDPAGVLDEQGGVTGLGRESSTSADAFILDSGVGNCVFADFGDGVDLRSVVVRMRAAAGACKGSCETDAMAENNCDAGKEALLAWGPSTAAFAARVNVSPLSATYTEHVFDVQSGTRVVAVCRVALDKDDSDVEVDVIRGTCR